jgi:ubiquinone/menaquinone biosynthesis C-methylase UbiE
MRNKLRISFVLLLAGLLGGAWRVYQTRERERVPSPESLDNPAVAAAFNRVAGWPQMRVLRRYVLQRIKNLVSKGEAVDIGCGPGHLIFDLARQLPNLQVTGIDISDEVLEQAESFAAQHGYGDRVCFKKGSAQAVPVPDESFDLVISTLSLHHWHEPVAVLNEVARILRPGGAFLIFDLRRDMAPPFYLLLWFATRFIVPRALRVANEPLGSRNAAYTRQEAVQLVEKSNLSGWRVIDGPLWLIIEGQKEISQ